MPATDPPDLPVRARWALAAQRAVACALAPLTTAAAALLLRVWRGLRFEDVAAHRRTYREARAAGTPLLVCGNHLTMFDSALIAYVLGSPGWYVLHPGSLPWNVPDRSHFASTPLQRALAWVYKCLPIDRGGAREDVAGTLARFTHLLRQGEVGLIFPEGGRSRSGRVEVESAAYGVGRIVKNVPGCRVLCVYVRGDAQEGHTDLPHRGDTIRARLALLEPKTDHAGLRGSRELARQILGRLAELEREYFDARG